jgi:hypothetical protein
MWQVRRTAQRLEQRCSWIAGGGAAAGSSSSRRAAGMRAQYEAVQLACSWRAACSGLHQCAAALLVGSEAPSVPPGCHCSPAVATPEGATNTAATSAQTAAVTAVKADAATAVATADCSCPAIATAAAATQPPSPLPPPPPAPPPQLLLPLLLLLLPLRSALLPGCALHQAGYRPTRCREGRKLGRT